MARIAKFLLPGLLIAASVQAAVSQERTSAGTVRAGEQTRVNAAQQRATYGGTASDFAIKSFRNGSQQPQGVINSPLVVPYGATFR